MISLSRQLAMPVYVPSLSRWERSLTLEALDGVDWPVCLVVPRDQVKRYEPLAARHKCMLTGCPKQGIARTRHWIGQNSGSAKFLMMDDDLRFYKRGDDPSETRLWKLEEGDMKEMLRYCSAMLDRYAHIAVSAREGNNRLELPYVTCSRPLRVLGYRTKPFLQCEHGRVAIMEDFDVTLQLLGMGYQNCVITKYAQDQPQTQAPGGCSDYRTHELHQQNVLKMAKLHGDLVKLREKDNKTGGEFGKRLEATIYWQKAWQQSLPEIFA
jgi:hypothetical protein